MNFAKKKYTVSVFLKTPPQATDLLLDLSTSLTLVDCSSYSSSTYRSVPCSSSLCSTIGSPDQGCSNDTCPVTLGKSLTGEARVDALYMKITDGRNPGRLSLLPEFLFSCTERSSIKGLTKEAEGLAGFGRSTSSFPTQVGSATSENSTFALCLSGSPSAPGVAFFGTTGPYNFYPEIDLSQHLYYTPLLLNQVVSKKKKYSNKANEYFIGLAFVNVNGKALEFDQTLLDINAKGRGGTMLSTVTPYTVLQRTIFKALTEAFVNESAALNLTVTSPVKPFRVCYNADDVPGMHTGPAVPTIDLVLQDGQIWRIFGSNSMVRIFRNDVDVWCLGFVDGGSKPRASIVIGGHQMQDNLLQFDLGSKKLGFSSSLLVYNTMCANFNFTTNNNL